MMALLSAVILVGAASIIVLVVAGLFKATVREVRDNKAIKGTDWIGVVIGIVIFVGFIYLKELT